jgi:hypothetical protein
MFGMVSINIVFPQDTIIIAIGGVKGGEKGDTSGEVLTPDSTECSMKGGPPEEMNGMVGGIHDGYIVQCGGKLYSEVDKASEKCYKLKPDKAEWEADEPLKEPRAYAAMVMVPKWGMWITGGEPAMVECCDCDS